MPMNCREFKENSVISWASEAFEKGGVVTWVGKFGTTNVYGTKMIKIRAEEAKPF